MTRLSDWHSRLHAYIAEVRDLPFRWGEQDCTTFVAGAVAAMTGRFPGAELRGYTTYAEGLERLHAAGYIDHIDLAASLFDEVRNKAMANVGDIAAVDSGDGTLALGIVGGANILLVSPERGLWFCDRSAAKRVFRV
jgi:hypothetical protein